MVGSVVKSNFSPNVVVKIKHGCKDPQRSLIINSKFVRNIPGWDAIESRLSVSIVDLKIWVGQEFILQALGGREAIGKM